MGEEITLPTGVKGDKLTAVGASFSTVISAGVAAVVGIDFCDAAPREPIPPQVPTCASQPESHDLGVSIYECD